MAFEIININQTSTYDIDDNDTVTLMQGVSLSTVNDGFDGNTGGDSDLSGVRLNILGTVISGSVGVDFFFAPVSSVNDTTVFIGVTGELHVNGDAVILDTGDGNSIVNYGSVTSGGFGLYFRGGDNNVIENHGSVSLVKSGNSVPNSAIFLGIGGTPTFINTGLVTGAEGSLGLVASWATDTIIFNSGQMIAINGLAYKEGGTGVASITNTGFIRGDIEFSSAADTYDGRGGTLDGTVFGDAGDDTYIIDDADISLVEFVDQGTDLVKAKVSFGLAENFENLTLIGRGDFDGTGNSGVNVITGNGGDNLLRGKGGADILAGKDSDDILRGGRGNDTLNGGHDNDILIGGAGRDKLTGGLDEDVFRFTKAAHSTNDSNADLILDFAIGTDLIDLKAFAGTLAFIGSAGFSGAAEVRIAEFGGNSIVRVDLDGDGAADMKIKVVGVTGMDATDFLL